MPLGKLAGIPIRIHPLTVICFLLYVYLGWGLEILAVFTVVLLHELAHGIVARLNGVKVNEVQLFPFGGQASFDDFTGLLPEREINIALAGPIFSLMLAGFFYFLPAEWFVQHKMLFTFNLYLGLFNLLPGLPLDGGRVVRALLAKRQGFKKASSRTIMMGKGLAVLIGVYGIYLFYSGENGLNAIMIFILLYWAAHREKSLLNYAFMRYLLHKKAELNSRGLLPGKQVICTGETLIKQVLEWTRPNYYLLIVMVNEAQQIKAIYTEAELIECYLNKGSHSRLLDL